MATYYALPSLTSWGPSPTFGWATSSNGTSISAAPGVSDDVIFDSFSGSNRSITISSNVACNSFTTAGSTGLTFVANTITTKDVTLASSTVMTSSLTIAPSSGTCTLQFANASINHLNISPTGTATINIIGNVNLNGSGSYTGQLGLFSGSTGTTILNMGSGSIKVGTVNVYNAASGTHNLNMGSCTLDVVAPGAYTVFNWQSGGNVVLNAQTSILKFSGSCAAGSITTVFPASGTFNILWNATTGSYIYGLRMSTVSCSVFKASPGSHTIASANGFITSAGAWMVEGTADALAKFSSDNFNSFSLTKSGGGTATFQYANFNGSITGAPANTFKALYSTVNGTLTNIEMLPHNSRFMSFF